MDVEKETLEFMLCFHHK